LSKKRLDYSDLVSALQEDHEEEANDLLAEIMPRLKDYLEVTMNAEENDAEECIHRAFANVYEKVINDKIKKEKYIFRYLLRACRHEYIRYMKNQHRFVPPEDENPHYILTPGEQIEKLMDKDRQRILEECLDELQKKSRRFIEYFIDKPDTTTKEASKHFKISGANVRTKKSRITSRLHHCFKRKWKK